MDVSVLKMDGGQRTLNNGGNKREGLADKAYYRNQFISVSIRRGIGAARKRKKTAVKQRAGNKELKKKEERW